MFDQDFINDCILRESKPNAYLNKITLKDPNGQVKYSGRKTWKVRQFAARLFGVSNNAMRHIWPKKLKEAGYEIIWEWR